MGKNNFFRKTTRKVGSAFSGIPVAGPVAEKIMTGAGKIIEDIAKGGASIVIGTGDLAENTVRESVKGTSKVISEVTGSRRKTNQQADAQNQALREQIMRFLNSRQEADIQALEQQLADALQTYVQARQHHEQGILNIAETIAVYRQWRLAVLEIEDNQVPTTALAKILGGDIEVLKNFLMEGEFRGGYNPLTRAIEKFLSGTLQPATFARLVNEAFNRLSDASDLFYLEQDFRGHTFAEHLFSAMDDGFLALTVEQSALLTEAKNKLIAQAIRDMSTAIHERDEVMLGRLIGLGEALLEQEIRPHGETVAQQIAEAGYEALLPERPRVRARP